MSYVRENDSTQNAHIKYSNDNRQGRMSLVTHLIAEQQR